MKTKFRSYAHKLVTFIMFLTMILIVATQAAFAEDIAPSVTTDNPDIYLTKEADELSFDAVGDVIHYTLEATNSGNVTLHNVMIFDPLLGILFFSSPPPAVLEPGGTLTATGIHIVNQLDLDIGFFLNAATASAIGPEPDCTPVVSIDNSYVPAVQNPDITLTKIAEEADYDEVGDVIHYTMEATNTGNVTLHDVTISDPLLSDLVFSPESLCFLCPGQTLTATGTYTVTQADLDAGHIYNIAEAQGKGPPLRCERVIDTAAEDVPAIQNPGIVLAKTAAEADYDEVGDVIHYALEAKNAGNVTLHDVTIADPLLGTLIFAPESPAILAPGEVLTATGIYTVTQADLDAGHLSNIGSAAGIGPSPADVPVSDTDDADVPAVQMPGISLTKSADELNYDEVGDIIHYTLEAKNIGNVTLHDVTITDAILGELVFTPDSPAILAPGQTLSASGEHIVTQADLDTGHFYNNAGTQGISPAPANEPVGDSANKDIPGISNPGISIVKTTNGGDGLFIPVDADVTWTYVLTNTGNVTLKNIIVTDSVLGDVGTNASLAPDVSITMAMSGTAVAGLYQNTGTVVASPPAGSSVTDSDDSSYFGAAPRILLVKTVQNTTTNVIAGDTATGTPGDDFLYTIVVTNTGNVDLTNVIVNDLKAVVGSIAMVDGTPVAWSAGVGGLAELKLANLAPNQQVIITFTFNTEPDEPSSNRFNIASVRAVAAYSVNNATPVTVRSEDFVSIKLVAVLGAYRTTDVLGAAKTGESSNYYLAGIGTVLLLCAGGVFIFIKTRRNHEGNGK